jgi:hypothetical protein
MKSRALLTTLAAMIMVMAPLAAQALTIDFIVPNADLADPAKSPAPFGALTINLTDPTHADISFTVPMSGPYADYYSIIKSPCFALNVNADSFSVGNLRYGPDTASDLVTYAGATGNVSQFGKFNAGFNGPNFAGGRDEINFLSFRLQNTSGTWDSADAVLALNNKDYLAVIHVVVDSGCNKGLTGFAGAVPLPSGAPIPGAAFLLGSGLLGLVGLRRFRKD